MAYLIKVYQNEPYKHVDSFVISSKSYLEALIDGAKIVREQYSNARVGEVIKSDEVTRAK